MRVYIAPQFDTPDAADGGIRRVVTAQNRYLPEFGIEVTRHIEEADLVVCHGTTLVEHPGVPMVSQCHGLYWSDYGWGDWHEDVNARVIDSMLRAQAITAPSQWVAHAISRGMLVRPHVVYHGVEADEWAHNEQHMGYVLWNKARVDPVSDPADMVELAKRMPDVPFASTFGQQIANIFLTGPMSYEQMKPVVQHAGVYLATARETFGIGTLEALAAGVPVVGWDYGGQSEIIIDGETGYLVPVGDYDGMVDALRRALAERPRLSANARHDALTRWGWRDKVELYADLYRTVVGEWQRKRPKVSVVITTHNLARYLDGALQSVARQTMPDWECIVVDDASTDNPQANVDQFRAEVHGAGGVKRRIDYLPTPRNLKLSGARNFGASHATGRYLLFLDADDMLAPDALQELCDGLDRDSSIHIAYGRLEIMDEAGKNRKLNPWPAATPFDWRGQMAHLNQLPYSSMWRRDAFLRTGGYRERDWRAEDASLWCRATSFGIRAARVTDKATLIYRLRSDSKGATERREYEDIDGDWTSWYPWRVGAASGKEGTELHKAGRQPNPRLVPFAAPPTGKRKAWPVRHYQHPAVSIIIPVGPGHDRYLMDALDSLVAQTIPDWEAIVILDADVSHDPSIAHPFATYITTGYTGKGAGVARNLGITAARAPLCLFLDADDILLPDALKALLRAHQASGGKYAYCDVALWKPDERIDGEHEHLPAAEYDQQDFLGRGYVEGRPGAHSITALVPTEAARAVGGFDEAMPGWEDWEFYLRLAAAGWCGVRVSEPLLLYRLHSGQRREIAKKEQQKLKALLAGRYAGYTTGEHVMAKCCGGVKAALDAAQQALNGVEPPVELLGGAAVRDDGLVRIEFVGAQVGAIPFRIPDTDIVIRAGNNRHDRFHNVDVRGVGHLLSLRDMDNEPLFRVVQR